MLPAPLLPSSVRIIVPCSLITWALLFYDEMWLQHSFLSTDLRATFGDKRHELNVNTHQMCILMLFNEADSLSFREIQETCSIPDMELKRSLQSLACAKVTFPIEPRYLDLLFALPSRQNTLALHEQISAV